MRRPHGGHVLGASPQIPFADDLSTRPGDIVCPQDQLLDLRMVQSWYQSGALKGGLWLPDWAYQMQDSSGVPINVIGQIVGLWRDCSYDPLPFSARRNILQWSEVFSAANRPDTVGGTGVTPVRAENFAPAFNGENTACRLQIDRGAGTASADYSMIKFSSNISLQIGTKVTFSLYVKSNTGSTQNLMCYVTGNSTITKISTFSVGTEYARITLTSNSAVTTGSFDIYLGSRGSYGGDQTLDIIVCCAQVDIGEVASEYQKIETGVLATVPGNHATQTTTANKPLTAITPVTSKPWLTADSTDVLPVVFPADVGKCNWTEVAGQIASQVNIRSLAVFNNKLYGGTASNGKLFEWNGTNAWVEVAGQLNSQTQMLSIAVFNSKLYGSTAPNGRLFEWNGTNAWVEVAGQLSSQINIRSLAVFNNKLYGGTAENGKLFEWNGANAWVEVAGQLSSQTYILSIAIFNNKLYGSTYPNGKLFEWNGTNAWVEVAGQLSSQTSVYSLAVFNNKLYGGTYPNGKLFEWNGSNAWVEVAGQLASQTYILSLAVFNNRLYGSTYPTGKLFEWNGTNAWVEVAGQLNSQTNVYSLAVFNSNLYGGTGETGRLFEFSRNACTIARATPTGVTFDENQIISTTWNNLIQPYQYNSAVLVADRQLTAREKAIVSRVLGAYVPGLGNEVLANYSFDTDLSGWSLLGTDANNTLTWENGGCRFVGNGSTLLMIRQNLLKIGFPYYIEASYEHTSGAGIKIPFNNFELFIQATSTKTYTILPDTTYAQISRAASGQASNGLVNYISFRPVL